MRRRNLLTSAIGVLGVTAGCMSSKPQYAHYYSPINFTSKSHLVVVSIRDADGNILLERADRLTGSRSRGIPEEITFSGTPQTATVSVNQQSPTTLEWPQNICSNEKSGLEVLIYADDGHAETEYSWDCQAIRASE